MIGKEEASALEFLDGLIDETPQVQRVARRERLRLELARFMKKAREAAGLTQTEVARALGVTQAWVSKLESPNYDHKLESVLNYFDAIGGGMNLSVDVAESTFLIWGRATVWNALVEKDLLAELDNDAEVQEKGRSKVIRNLVESYLKERGDAILEPQYVAGYGSGDRVCDDLKSWDEEGERPDE